MSANDPVRDHPVCSAIKRLRADNLVVYVGDETRKVAVPRAGARWSKLARILDGMPWDVIEAYDKDGKLLARIENPDDEEEAETEPEEGSTAQLTRLAGVISGVVASTMKECRTMFEVQMRGQAELTAAMVEGMRSVTESYQLALKVQTAAAMHAAAGGGDEPGGMPPGLMQMFQAVMMMQSRGGGAPAPQIAAPHKPAGDA